MAYYIDLASITLDEYRERLKTADLLPSRRILQQNIDKYFDYIKGQNVANVDALWRALSTKKKIADFSSKSGVPEEYLKILIREVKSYRQPPIKLKDFPNVSEAVVQKLQNVGIIHTRHLFDKVLTPQSRTALAHQAGIAEPDILTLAKLTDLGRVRWVNHTFAYMLLESGYETAEQVAKADYKVMYEKVDQLNQDRQLFKGKIGLHDLKLCVEAAKELTFDLEL